MYEEERKAMAEQRAMQANVPFQYADTMGGALVGESRPVQNSLNDHGEQLAKLNELVGMLESRLMIVRNTHPAADNFSKEPTAPTSLMVAQIKEHTTTVHSLQSRVSQMLDDLEV